MQRNIRKSSKIAEKKLPGLQNDVVANGGKREDCKFEFQPIVWVPESDYNL